MSHIPSILSGFAAGAASMGLGALVLPFLRARPDFLKAAAAGLFLGPVLVWAAGMNGLASGLLAWAAALAGIAALASPEGRRALRGIVPETKALVSAPQVPLLIAAVLACAVAFSFFLCLVPPTSHEALSADLVLPQQYSLVHKVCAMPWFVPSLTAIVPRAGYLWCFLLGGDWAGCAVLNWIHAVLACFLLARIGARAGLSAGASTGAAAVWAASPLFLGLSSVPLSYAHAAFYVLMTVLAVQACAGRAGLWAGAAGACRWGGWVIAPAAAAFVLFGKRKGGRLRAAGTLTAVSLVPLFCVAAWNYLSAGSPLAPFFPGGEAAEKIGGWLSDARAAEKSLVGALAYPVQSLFGPNAVPGTENPPPGGLLLGLYLVPFAFGFGRKLVPGGFAWPALAAAVFYAAFFAFDWPLAAAAPAAGLCALLLSGTASRLGRGGVAALTAVFVLLGAAQSGDFLKRAADFIRAGGKTEAYLSASSETFWPYPALKYIRENAAAGARVLPVFESRIYYAQRRSVPALMQDRSALERVLEESSSPADVAKRLHALSVSHVLLAEDIEIKRLDQYIRYLKDREIQLLADFLRGNAEVLYGDPGEHCKVVGVKAYGPAPREKSAGPGKPSRAKRKG